jgi:hypothetical protein
VPRNSGNDRKRRAKNPVGAQELAEGLTVLERLALRALPGRQVPAESGVQFAISSQAKDDGICLVLLVDDRESPIFPDAEGPRPDYLVLHISRHGCVLTIVEMKGREEKGIEHGVEQIRAFYRRLRKEMAACLPGSWRRAHILAVLLMPENAQINRKKINDARSEGIEIYPLAFHHQAELYPYISQRLSLTQSYKHKALPRQRPELNDVEQLLTMGRLARRIRDAHFTQRRGSADDTFYLNFRRANDTGAQDVSLSTTTTDAVVRFSAAAIETQKMVCKHLEKHALACSALRIETTPI